MAVAHHLLRAGPIAEPQLVIDTCARAGDEAFSLGAWGPAVWYYDEAAKAAASIERGGGNSPIPIVELHLRAGEAAQHDVDSTAAEPHLSRAIELARAAGDLPRWARALFAQMRLRVTTSGVDADPASLRDFLDAAGDEVPELRAEALALLAEYEFTISDPEHGAATAQSSLELASSVGDERLGAYVWFSLGLQHLRTLAPARAAECFERGLAHAEAAGSTRYVIWNTGRIPVAQWQLGEIDAAVVGAERAQSLSTTHQYWAEHSLACSLGAGLAVTQGRFRDAERLAESALQTLRRTEFTVTPPSSSAPSLPVARGAATMQAPTRPSRCGAVRGAVVLDASRCSSTPSPVIVEASKRSSRRHLGATPPGRRLISSGFRRSPPKWRSAMRLETSPCSPRPSPASLRRSTRE